MCAGLTLRGGGLGAFGSEFSISKFSAEPKGEISHETQCTFACAVVCSRVGDLLAALGDEGNSSDRK